MIADSTELQRAVARAALEALHDHSFALAGSGAIREHGFIHRLSHDVDLFSDDLQSFGEAVGVVARGLVADSYSVEIVRRTPTFAQLLVTTASGEAVSLDLAVDWRSSAPASSDVGPVLSVEDAVGNKVVAIYGRTEARDFLDLDSIRRSGRFSDAELLRLAAERDDGFDAGIYARQLGAIERIREERFAEYGVNGEELAAVRRRILEWADIILSSDGRPEP